MAESGQKPDAKAGAVLGAPISQVFAVDVRRAAALT